jgi:hypothetical protein
MTVTVKNEKLDDLLDKASSTSDPKEKNELVKEIQRRIIDDVPAIFCFELTQVDVARSNVKGYTYNLSLTPNLRLPTGSTDDDWAVGDGSWDAGLSLSYSFETPKWYHLYDLYYWKNGSGRNFDHGDELAFDANIGWHAWHDGDNGRGLFLMLDIAARHIEPGKNQMVDPAGDTIAVGPVAMYYHEDWMLKFEYRQVVYDKAKTMRFGDHRRFAVGFGLTF